MAKKKKKADEQVSRFHGGPRDGFVMPSIGWPEYIRLAFPEWCLYQHTGSGNYDYIGSHAAPTKELQW